MTPATSYLPGPHSVVAWPGGVMLIASRLGLDSQIALYRALCEAATLRQAVEALAESCSAGVLDLPDFAAVVAQDGSHVVAARGSVQAEGLSTDGPFAVDGSRHAVWAEQTVSGLSQVGVNISGGSGLPLVGGVVAASGFWWQPQEGTAVEPQPTRAQRARDSVGNTAPAAEVTSVTGTTPEPMVATAESVESSGEPEPAAAPERERHHPTPAPVTALEETGEAHWVPTTGLDPFTSIPGGAAAPEPEAERTLINAIPAVTGRRFAGEDNTTSTDGDAPEPDDGVQPWLGARVTPLRSSSDGGSHTVMAAHMGMLAPSVESSALDDGTVLAAACTVGHLNPPHRVECHVCGLPTGADTSRVARPSLGWIRATTGEEAELTGPVIIGRDPRAARIQGGHVPALMVLPYPHVTANHVELRLDGWNVLAVDLHSRNGTYLRRDGQSPVRLPDQPVLLRSGDVLDLGKGLALMLDSLP